MSPFLIPKGFPHHAYCLLGKPEENLPMLFEFLKGEGIVQEANPDFILIKEDSLAIGTVRSIHEKVSYNSQSGNKKIVIICVRAIRSEAGNAFLKLAEEPPKDTHIFLLIDSREKMLPTLQSRFFFIDCREKSDLSLAKKFLELSTPLRLDYVKKLVEDIKDEKKEKKHAVELFDSVLSVLAKEKNPKNARALSRVVEMREFLETPGASLKMLLESLCFLTS